MIKNITFKCDNVKCGKTFRASLDTTEYKSPEKRLATVKEEGGYYGEYSIYIQVKCPHCEKQMEDSIYYGSASYCTCDYDY